MKSKPSSTAQSASASRRVVDSIRRIVRALRVSSRLAEKRAGLSGAQLFVLQRLSEGEPMTINELAARTLTHQSSVSVVLTRLAARKFVARLRNTEDGRSVSIHLTAAGKRALKASPDLAQASLFDCLAKMPARRRSILAKELEFLVRSAGFASEDPTLFFEDDRA